MLQWYSIFYFIMECVTHKEDMCDACLAGKQIIHSFPTKAIVRTSKPLGLLLGYLCRRNAPPMPADNRDALYWVKRFHTNREGEFASDELNIFCEENWVEAMAAELNSITRNKIWELVDRSTGSEKKEEENRVCVLHKTLYVLHQTPRAWNVKVDQVLKEMPKKFEMLDLGELTYYLGIEVIQGADEIPCDIKMKACNATYIPMEANLKISKPEDEREIEATEFTRNVGCLRYLLHTRPDLAYCVRVLSGYMLCCVESMTSIPERNI